MSEAAARLVADEMLGKLARELRALGYDVSYETGVEDDQLLARARDEDRLLLTRDRRLAEAAGDRALLVVSREPPEQLGQVLSQAGLDPKSSRFLSRCVACNGTLEEAPEVPEAEVPESVRGRQLWRCTGCEKVYWWGTHAEDMYDRLGPLVGERPGWADAEHNR